MPPCADGTPGNRRRLRPGDDGEPQGPGWIRQRDARSRRRRRLHRQRDACGQLHRKRPPDAPCRERNERHLAPWTFITLDGARHQVAARKAGRPGNGAAQRTADHGARDRAGRAMADDPGELPIPDVHVQLPGSATKRKCGPAAGVSQRRPPAEGEDGASRMGHPLPIGPLDGTRVPSEGDRWPYSPRDMRWTLIARAWDALPAPAYQVGSGDAGKETRDATDACL
jgi:hypothetical protein